MSKPLNPKLGQNHNEPTKAMANRQERFFYFISKLTPLQKLNRIGIKYAFDLKLQTQKHKLRKK